MGCGPSSMEGMEDGGGPSVTEAKKDGVRTAGGPKFSIKNLGTGCYCDYDPRSGGALFIQWAKGRPVEMPDGPRAFFNTTRDVPAFKFTQNHGRTDLIGGCATNKAKYFEGWCSFFKMAKQNGGKALVRDWDGRDIEVAFLSDTGHVAKLKPNHLFDVDKVAAVGVVPRRSVLYNGMQKTTVSVFIGQTAGNEGASLVL